jgi:Holliday junction resolvase RusA-like endonuclease
MEDSWLDRWGARGGFTGRVAGGCLVIEFFVEGRPMPQPRPRASNRSGVVHMYNKYSGKAKAWRETLVIECGKRRPPTPINNAVHLELQFKFPGKKTIPHIKRPDIDNLVKMVMDVLTMSSVFSDDDVVYSLVAGKIYTPEPSGCLIRIQEIV